MPEGTSDPYRRGRRQVFGLHAHLVFAPKYRRKVLDGPMLDTCERVMAQACAELGALLAEFNGERDHVHLLVDYPPTLSLSRLVARMKGRSSYELHKRFPSQIRRARMGRHFWSPSYFVASVGGAPISVLRDYIEHQDSPRRYGGAYPSRP